MVYGVGVNNKGEYNSYKDSKAYSYGEVFFKGVTAKNSLITKLKAA